jgi:hypothetical protein
MSVLAACVLLCLVPAAARADLAPYSQDFEGLNPGAPGDPSLANDGWLVFANVFSPDGQFFYYNYGPFPAPNNDATSGAAFCNVKAGFGGPAQGAQQLDVFSDYNNEGSHNLGHRIESNVFQEQVIGAADIGTTWLFNFDAKKGNIGGATTAKAFFKVINPFAGYSLSRFVWIDMTNVPADWTSYSLPFYIDPALQGQILQFGFLNTASYFEGSGIYYDNLSFLRSLQMDVRPGGCPNPVNTQTLGVLPVAVLGTDMFDVSEIDPATVRFEGQAPLRWSYADVATPYTGDLCGCTEAGPDGFMDLSLKFEFQMVLGGIGDLVPGDFKVTLTGNLVDGTPFQAQDCVVAVGGGLGCSQPQLLPLEPAPLTTDPSETELESSRFENRPLRRSSSSR